MPMSLSLSADVVFDAIFAAHDRMLAAFTLGLELNSTDKLNEAISGTIKLQFR